jgi:hypothetical protein
MGVTQTKRERQRNHQHHSKVVKLCKLIELLAIECVKIRNGLERPKDCNNRNSNQT